MLYNGLHNKFWLFKRIYDLKKLCMDKFVPLGTQTPCRDVMYQICKLFNMLYNKRSAI